MQRVAKAARFAKRCVLDPLEQDRPGLQRRKAGGRIVGQPLQLAGRRQADRRGEVDWPDRIVLGRGELVIQHQRRRKGHECKTELEGGAEQCFALR